MWSPFQFFRINTEADAENIETLRDIIARSLDVLKGSTPDTFLGRKTQEPFPASDDAASVEGWLASKELLPPN